MKNLTILIHVYISEYLPRMLRLYFNLTTLHLHRTSKSQKKFFLLSVAENSLDKSLGEHSLVHQNEDLDSDDGGHDQGGVVKHLVLGASSLVNLKLKIKLFPTTKTK